MGYEWASVLVAGIAAVVSVIAAAYAARQAKEAKRQADAAHGEIDPTFHPKPVGEDAPPWRFQLCIRNFNRRPLRVETIRVSMPPGMVVWDVHRQGDTLGALDCAGSDLSGEPERWFSIDYVLDGVAPSAAESSTFSTLFAAGFRSAAKPTKSAQLTVHIDWHYVSGDAARRTDMVPVELGSA